MISSLFPFDDLPYRCCYFLAVASVVMALGHDADAMTGKSDDRVTRSALDAPRKAGITQNPLNLAEKLCANRLGHGPKLR
jgi:hypothetical protein